MKKLLTLCTALALTACAGPRVETIDLPPTADKRFLAVEQRKSEIDAQIDAISRANLTREEKLRRILALTEELQRLESQ